MITRRRLLVLIASATALAACDRDSAPSTSGAPDRPAGSPVVSGVGVVAEVNGAPIMAPELEERLSGRLARLRQEEYEIRRAALEELVAERLLDAEAVKRNLSKDELLRREVDGKAAAPEASLVESVYQQNRPRFSGQTKEQALARVREALTERGRSERRQAYLASLRREARVALRLEVPRARVELPADAPSRGPRSAPVTVVEFTDYQCPYCHRAQNVVDQLLSRYGGKLRFVHRDFPLDGHPGAVPAARAARCAGEQGRFWEYHHGLMTAPGLLDEQDLKARAARLALQAGPFASCVASTRHDAAIRASFEQGESLGVTGTPAYFVNGRMLSGARPLEDFTEVIDAELASR